MRQPAEAKSLAGRADAAESRGRECAFQCAAARKLFGDQRAIGKEQDDGGGRGIFVDRGR